MFSCPEQDPDPLGSRNLGMFGDPEPIHEQKQSKIILKFSLKWTLMYNSNVLCRACLHFFFIDHQSVRELRITRILKDAVFQGRNVLGPNEQSVEFFPRRGGISSHTCLFLAPTSSPPLPPPHQAWPLSLRFPPPSFSPPPPPSQAPLFQRRAGLSVSRAPTGACSL